jgi:hypothetical protein
MLWAVRLYNKGFITRHEFVSSVAKWGSLNEMDEFIRDCPSDLMEYLKAELESYGVDESKWPRTFRAGSYFPWVTAQEIEESQSQEQECIWNGVRLLKQHIR